MSRYYVSFRYSKDGKTWTTSSLTVEAESQRDAMEIVQSRYTYIQFLRVVKR